MNAETDWSILWITSSEVSFQLAGSNCSNHSTVGSNFQQKKKKQNAMTTIDTTMYVARLTVDPTIPTPMSSAFMTTCAMAW